MVFREERRRGFLGIWEWVTNMAWGGDVVELVDGGHGLWEDIVISSIPGRQNPEV